jgi:cytochrome c peroxidase
VQEINLAQVELGKKLYFDPRLSNRGSSPAIPATT